MKLIWKHLTSGLIYASSFKLIPMMVGTIIPFFWQLVNFYGTLPALLLIFGVFQILIVSIAAIIYPLLFLKLTFIEVYFIAVFFMVIAIVSWQIVNIFINRRASFKLIKLQLSSRTTFILLGLMLCNRLVSVPISSRTMFYDIHLKPKLAGQLKSKSKDQIITAISHDYQQLLNLTDDAVFFGCSPGSFKQLLIDAGLKESQFIIMETIIPKKHAQIFGLRRHFYFYVISTKDKDS
ncbi:hypothetical protein SYNTR_0190 [Candidatus Syntrophocurvum alkaliphilum]|uniref:Uncharacterized protein n=1 Tax=Candidatus Syntrophocurvum alkaliphilum TaxID=2293317 RepID=A0A6I6D687_9FIRM|nr:hypothetical protein [Candidatus Syntrophocurvum alkaliphilum]QGT98783.1 hypothetical protein SYNTR_0190 [Candidatus Syntrophocurvum alkaliphilum]